MPKTTKLLNIKKIPLNIEQIDNANISTQEDMLLDMVTNDEKLKPERELFQPEPEAEDEKVDPSLLGDAAPEKKDKKKKKPLKLLVLEEPRQEPPIPHKISPQESEEPPQRKRRPPPIYSTDKNFMYDREEDEEKRELLFKFSILQKSYPNIAIPTYSTHSNLQSMKRMYEETIKKLAVDTKVESYKKYLIYGFMICEFSLGYFFGFDMKGFTQQQAEQINSYEKMLIELGERKYLSYESNLPVELRLILFIIFNAAVFIILKKTINNSGVNIMNFINKVIEPKEVKVMKPPTIDISQLSS